MDCTENRLCWHLRFLYGSSALFTGPTSTDFSKFFFKIGSLLFTHLKVISLQYFQFSIINSIQTHLKLAICKIKSDAYNLHISTNLKNQNEPVTWVFIRVSLETDLKIQARGAETRKKIQVKKKYQNLSNIHNTFNYKFNISHYFSIYKFI